MRWRLVFSWMAAALVLAAPIEAHADADTARQHFETGKRLRDDGDCVHAIPEFDKSLAADKSIGAYYNLGFCHEQLGHKQEAYEAYKSARELASAKKDDRLREISGAIASLLETPHIRLVLPQPLPEGLKITVDDQPVPPGFYQAETVIFTKNNKYHLVVVTAPGYEERRENVETKQVKPVELRPVNVKSATGPPPPSEGGWRGQHWLGLGLAGAGVLAAGATALLYLGHRSNLDTITSTYESESLGCQTSPPPGQNPKTCESNARLRHNEDTTSENTRATITVGGVGAVAVALLVSGGILFLSASPGDGPKKTRGEGTTLHVAPVVGGPTRGLALTGTF